MQTLRRFLSPILASALLLAGFTATAARETREVYTFNQVTLAGSATVILVQGSPQKVVVDAQPEDLTHLETAVSSNRLRIGTKQEKGMSWSNYKFKGPVTVYVTVPSVNALTVSGSGRMKAADGVKAQELALNVSGSGTLDLGPVQTEELQTTVSGSGNVSLGAGTAPRQSVSISGSGSLQAAKVRSNVCNVRISGSGNCRLNATETLDARISGSGNVYVTGGAKVSSSTAGSGRVRQE
ncbi:head GIN domain-containing protein [Hymenobacter norwichensis]|uniref:head GIN domain-containing protein n=1 Tax=Hymenobacter norwichensis TaxID=223903 RepID=UPI0003B394F3|nr:head GIN domain-containing protein [Hymenobacter norwichensis]